MIRPVDVVTRQLSTRNVASNGIPHTGGNSRGVRSTSNRTQARARQRSTTKRKRWAGDEQSYTLYNNLTLAGASSELLNFVENTVSTIT